MAGVASRPSADSIPPEVHMHRSCVVGKRWVGLATIVAAWLLLTASKPWAHIDHLWTRPGFDASSLQHIAVLPVAAFNGNREASFAVGHRLPQGTNSLGIE